MVLILFLLLLFSVPARADYPAGHFWYNNYQVGGFNFASAGAACAALSGASLTFRLGACSSEGDCHCDAVDVATGAVNTDHPARARWSSPTANECPYGGTLSGSTCVVTCPNGQTVGADGFTCQENKCKTKQGANGPVTVFRGWTVCTDSVKCIVGSLASVPSTACGDDLCEMSVGSAIDCSAASGASVDSPKAASCTYKGVYTGNTCSTSSATTTTPPPTIPTKSPPCASGEGVMTSSSGKVACVPAGTPNTTNPAPAPKVNVDEKTSPQPDSSSVSEKTITTCDPATGACNSTKSKTVNPKSDGTPGTAGTPGTSITNVTDKTSSDFCRNNPTTQICQGGMATEQTLKKVSDALTPGADATYNKVNTAGESDQAKADYKSANDKFTDAATGKTDSTSDSKSAWRQAMESGWFDPIPTSTCGPIEQALPLGGTWSFDPCPVAEKTASILEWSLWFGIVVGVFVWFTGGKQS